VATYRCYCKGKLYLLFDVLKLQVKVEDTKETLQYCGRTMKAKVDNQGEL